MDKYDGLYLFFEDEIEKTKEKWIQAGIQTGVQIGIQTGIQIGIHNAICLTLCAKYEIKSVPKSLKEKIDSINYYPALEEVQTAAIRTPSLAVFRRKVDEIAKKYDAEIQERL